MLRFEAGPEEVEGLLKFLRRRAPQQRLLLALLPDELGKPSRAKHRPCVTALPLLRDLEEYGTARRWGIAFPTTDTDSSLSSADFLMQLSFGPADALGRRDVLLEVHDELEGDPPDLSARALLTRSLGDRAFRRLRRRGCHEGSHWVLPS